MTRDKAKQIVARMTELTQKDMVKAFESEEFCELRERLLAGGWAMLAGDFTHVSGRHFTCNMRLTTPDDPEWRALLPEDGE